MLVKWFPFSLCLWLLRGWGNLYRLSENKFHTRFMQDKSTLIEECFLCHIQPDGGGDMLVSVQLCINFYNTSHNCSNFYKYKRLHRRVGMVLNSTQTRAVGITDKVHPYILFLSNNASGPSFCSMTPSTHLVPGWRFLAIMLWPMWDWSLLTCSMWAAFAWPASLSRVTLIILKRVHIWYMSTESLQS